VSPLFARVVRAALAAASATDGLVDPSLGLAIEAAGYDRDFSLLGADGRPPAPTGAGELAVDPRCRAAPLPAARDAARPERRGEGALGRRGAAARSRRRLRGRRRRRRAAVVGLPGGGSTKLLRGGLATSATTRRRWLRRGEAQHRLLDPRTGRPGASRWTHVTVAAGTCLAADVAAKAAFLRSDEGPEWLDGLGLPGRFVDGERVVTNAAWRRPAPGAAA
jgi:FAD:protein FMN transferase